MQAWELEPVRQASVFCGMPLAPSHPYVHHKVIEALLTAQKPPGGFQWAFCANFDVAEARNILVKQFLRTSCTHMLFLDSDIIIQPDTIVKLLQCRKPVVSAAYFEKRGGMSMQAYYHSEVPWRRDPQVEYRDGELVEAELIGMGCVLIERWVFEKTDYPWFRYTLHDENLPDDERIGEDFTFAYTTCFKKLGIRPYVATGVKVGHIGQAVVWGKGDVRLL